MDPDTDPRVIQQVRQADERITNQLASLRSILNDERLSPSAQLLGVLMHWEAEPMTDVEIAMRLGWDQFMVEDARAELVAARLL